MATADLALLIERVQRGDPAAFQDLVTVTITDLRLFIANHVPTQALGDAVLREAYGAIRREIARCPTNDASGWMCRIAATFVGMRLADAARGATAAKDPLIHLIAQAGADALAANPTADNPAASELPRRLQMQPPSLRQLLQRHYAEGLTVATIAEKQGLVEGEVAQALLAARARMDWTGVAEVGDTADRTFPGVIEDYLAGTLVPDTRALLVAAVTHDPARAVQFERQVRLHLLIQVLLTPFDAAQIKEFITGLPGFLNDSSRLIVPPRAAGKGTGRITAGAKPGSGPRPRGETSRTRRQITETGSPTRGFVKGVSGTRQTAVATDDLGEDAPPPPNRVPFYIGGGIVALGLIVLVAVWLRPSSAPRVEERRAQEEGAPTVLGDPLFALISEAEGAAVIRHAGQTRPAVGGEAFSPGDGLELSGAGQLKALVADQVRLTLGNDARTSDIILTDQVLALQVDQGRVKISHLRGPKVSSVSVRTPQSRVTLPDASAVVEVVDGVTRVQTERGKPVITRADGAKAVEGVAGGVVVVRAGADPAVDGGGAFVRGINFGEGVVTIERNQWLSLNEALGAGLTVAPGARLGDLAQISGAGMDFDVKRMLDNGLVGEGGRLSVRQTVPNGDYDLTLWVAGPADATFDQVTLAVGGTPIPLGAPAGKGDRWRRIGPCRVQVRSRSLELALAGLGQAHLAGLEIDAAGQLDGVMPPMALIVDPPSGARIPPLDVAIRTRVESASGIAKVAFYNGEILLGESTSPPYSFIWRAPPVGSYTLSAVVTDSAGSTSRSAPVAGTVQDLAQSRGLMREVWRRIGGSGIGDLRGHLAKEPSDTDLVPNTDYRLSGSDFGARFRGTLIPPMDGDYLIEVSSDDGSEVWLSTDAEPANRRLVCSLPSYVEQGQWDRQPSQRSQPIMLKKDQRCFIEVLYKQGGGGAHLKLGWVRPDGTTQRPIPDDRFAPVALGPLPPPAAGVAKPAPPAPTTRGAAVTPPAVVPREVPQVPAGPQLRGSVAPSAQVANLSDLGSSDWIQYGIKDARSFTRRDGGPEMIGVAKTTDNAEIHHYGDNHVRFGWNDGMPTRVSAATATGWWVDNRSKGFTFTVPADPVLRRVMVWVGGHQTVGSFTATLSDGSAPPYRDESVDIPQGNGWYCYTLLYRARSNGANLTITWSALKAQDGNVTLQAVALSEFGDGKPRFVKGVNLGGDTTAFGGNTWLGQKEAETAGLVVYNSRRITSGEPVPAVEPGMKPMLRSGVSAKSGDLEIVDRGLPNGRYEVTLYVAENGTANSRLLDLAVNEATVNDVGQLPRNGWAAYGPLTATVTKGALAITVKAKKGAAQLMGFAVHAAGSDSGPWTNAFPAGRAHAIPGTLLFADFDRGANGVAFLEREDKPRNPYYRTEPVGINSYHGAPVVAYIPNGEWLRYTVDVKEAGTYTVTVRYGKANGADPRNARVQFEVDGKAVGGELRLEDTQRWDNAKTVTSQPFGLTVGIHDLRALFLGEQDEIGDFWSMEFKKVP